MTTQPPQELPELPKNVQHIMRRIRACEGEEAARIVLEHALREYGRACIAASQAGRAEPIARLLRWEAPKNIPVPHGGVCARTFAEFPKGAGENGYWKEGVPLYSTTPLEVRESAKCGYCGGSGSVNSWTTATSIDICFKCNGAGTATAKGE